MDGGNQAVVTKLWLPIHFCGLELSLLHVSVLRQ